MTIKIIKGWTRDLGIPADWQAEVEAGTATLHNAARPFPCTEDKTGEFARGVFYGIIRNSDEFAESHRKRAAELDATEIVFVQRETVETWGRAYCERHGLKYESYDFDNIAKSWLRYHKEGK